MKQFILLILCSILPYSISLAINTPAFPEGLHDQEPQIVVQNTVLAQINNKIISVIDVKKKMDFTFNQQYANLKDNPMARYQFYLSGWRHILEELINTELILLDANTKGVKINDGEVREELENRFGPNILLKLDNLNITYEDARELTKTDMLVKKMTGYYVSYKAYHSITPEMVKQAYRLHCEKNPSQEKWTYQFMTIRCDDEELQREISNQIYDEIENKSDLSCEDLQNTIREYEEKYKKAHIQLSQMLSMTTKEISDAHRQVLSEMVPGNYSHPIVEQSRSSFSTLSRIFFLKSHEKIENPSFETMASKLKETLFQKIAQEEYQRYCNKLQRRYSYDIAQILESLPSDFSPFVLK